MKVFALLALAIVQQGVFNGGQFIRGSVSEFMVHPQVGQRPLAAAITFAAVPNVTVSYYDVSGANIRDIHRSLENKAPRDPKTHEAIPAQSGWTIKAGIKFEKTDKKCRITNASVEFLATVVMPHLIPQKEQTAPVVKAWHAYVTKLEARQAEQLHFAYDRIGDVKEAILHSDCDRWQSVAGAAIDRVDRQQHLARQQNRGREPKLEEVENS